MKRFDEKIFSQIIEKEKWDNEQEFRFFRVLSDNGKRKSLVFCKNTSQNSVLLSCIKFNYVVEHPQEHISKTSTITLDLIKRVYISSLRCAAYNGDIFMICYN